MFLKVAVFSLLVVSGQCLDLDTFYKYVAEDNGTSSNSECEQQKTAFLQGLIKSDAWALKMLDAFGRIPEGLTQGNLVDMGMFDQCLNIFEKLDTTEIKGRYCYGGLIIPVLEQNTNSSQINELITNRITRSIQPTITSIEEDTAISITSVLLLAACVPDACLPSDFFGQLGIDSMCQTKDETKKLNTEDIACLVFFVVVIWLAIASTVYDVYLQKTSREPKHKILLTFSVYTNGAEIIKTNQQSGQILFFNGMKVLSMFWVIMGHRYSMLEAFVVNPEEAEAWRRNWYAFYVLLAPLAVDTFLFVSGALLAYTFLKGMRKPNQKFNIVIYYLHRYIRLTPALAVVYFFQVTLARRIQDGPLFPILDNYVESTCLNGNWWSIFLYVQNYVTTDKMCMIHTWYLSIDMQLYIISPLLLLPMLYWGKKIIYTVLPILVLINITYTMLIFYFYDIALWSQDYYNMFYYVTHTRLSPWLIGLIFGAFLLDYQANKQRYEIRNKLIILAMWGAVFCLIAFLFFFQDDADYNHTRIKSTFFFSLQRPLWTLCLCWISFACLSGKAGFINSFLSMSVFQILSKVTYSTYLIHATLLLLSMGATRISPYFTDYDAIRMTIADICISYAVGALWTLAFESPILLFEKIVFSQGGESKRNQIASRHNAESIKPNDDDKVIEPSTSIIESTHA